MRKTIIAFAMVAMFTTCAGCNSNYNNCMNYNFDRAIMKMPDGEIVEVGIEKWADADCDQIMINGKDGKKYLINSKNCVLIEDEAE